MHHARLLPSALRQRARMLHHGTSHGTRITRVAWIHTGIPAHRYAATPVTKTLVSTATARSTAIAPDAEVLIYPTP